MAEKWNDDKTEVTLSKDDFDSLKNQASSSFDKGFGAGKDKGKTEVLGGLESLGFNADNIQARAGEIGTQLAALKDPVQLKGLLGEEVKDLDVVKTLKQDLEAEKTAHVETKKQADAFRQTQLIDNNITALARMVPEDGSRGEAFNDAAVTDAFKKAFSVTLNDKGEVQISQSNGAPVFGADGKETNVAGAFEIFAANNSWMFKGTQNGGSGDDGKGGGGNVNTIDDLKTDAEKSEYMQKHGLAAFQDLVNKKQRQS